MTRSILIASLTRAADDLAAVVILAVPLGALGVWWLVFWI